MDKYIDAEKLIAKLRKHLIPTILDRDYDEWEKGKDAGFLQAIEIVESLQQEQLEVDLEKFDKEATKIWGRCAADPNDPIACFHIETFNEIASHFFELGLNARKEE